VAELAVRMVVSLAVVLGLVILIARFSQKRFKGRTGSPLQVVHRQSLSRNTGVALVQVGDRMLLLGTTDQQVQMLTEVDPVAVPTDSRVETSDAAVETSDVPIEAARADSTVATPDGTVSGPDSLFGPLAGLVEEPTRWAPTGAKRKPVPDVSVAAVAPAVPVVPARPVRPVRQGRPTMPALADMTARPAAAAAVAPAALAPVEEAEVASFAATLEAELEAELKAVLDKPKLSPAQVLLAEEQDASPLAGSLLSPDTWRLAARAVTRRAS
jgi:flagellar protein FliO/FliZ